MSPDQALSTGSVSKCAMRNPLVLYLRISAFSVFILAAAFDTNPRVCSLWFVVTARYVLYVL